MLNTYIANEISSGFVQSFLDIKLDSMHAYGKIKYKPTFILV